MGNFRAENFGFSEVALCVSNLKEPLVYLLCLENSTRQLFFFFFVEVGSENWVYAGG